MVASGEEVRVHNLPMNDKNAFPENIDTDPEKRVFYTGSLVNGTVYRGRPDSDCVEVFLTPESSGLKSAAGIKVDKQSRLWIIDPEGCVLVYDTGEKVKLHTFVLEGLEGKGKGKGDAIVNDLTLSGEFAYVTDSGRPFLYCLPVTLPANNPVTRVTSVPPWLMVDHPISSGYAKIHLAST
jgi:hypothetical protein